MTSDRLPVLPTARASLALFFSALPSLLKAIVPLLIAGSALTYAGGMSAGVVALLLWCLAFLVSVFVGFRTVGILLEYLGEQFDPARRRTTVGAVFAFLVVIAYMQLAVIFSAFFFLVPGLLVYACTAIAPALVVAVVLYGRLHSDRVP